MSALLPEYWIVELGNVEVELHVGGKEKSVVLVDCTQRAELAVKRIATFIRHHLSLTANNGRPSGSLALDPKVIEEKVQECLRNLHIFRPSSPLQLASTILCLPEYVKENSMPELAYLLIDGSSEWAWMEQLAREESRTPNLSHRHFLAAIARVRTTLSPLIFITQWVLKDGAITHRSSGNMPFYQHHQPQPYTQISTPIPSLPAWDPLKPPLLPGTDKPTFFIKYHITCHPPELKRDGTVVRVGDSMPGFKAVVRSAGGKELGEFDWEVLPHAIAV